MTLNIAIHLDRQARQSLVEQIAGEIRNAIAAGRLLPGARLPSWHDLAAQLGVARGTVRAAYERLGDEQLVASAGAAGTYVTARPAPRPIAHQGAPRALPPILQGAGGEPNLFQLGVPAQDAFPAKTWSRLQVQAARQVGAHAVGYPDPCGEAELRREIVASLAIARGIACSPEQVFITAGYAGAFGLALQILQLKGARCWMEDPGYLFARRALELAGLQPVPIPVDEEGLDVATGLALAPDAEVALVTPGQQAPLGVTLSLPRRQALLDWAAQRGAWIIEDDYLGELQLKGRAAPALAALDRTGRVLHIGTFSKTINPALRLGFLVVPEELASRFLESASFLGPAPAPVAQLAVAAFLREGHYLRHLRRMKRIYGERRQQLSTCLTAQGVHHRLAGLSVLRHLPPDCDDAALARMARQQGLYPMPLSPWFARPESAHRGLLLGVTNVPPERAADCCERLDALVRLSSNLAEPR
ncbi:MAG TPA: PLP-dependent aminotransferase family protein [Rhodocyclaceae bacterium]|jgi:GntR family transcriptional regulator/MocR family aminotransferase|nr:PLP-dependent aminotransferase family protein [Rhodocyclaceae bacterium]